MPRWMKNALIAASLAAIATTGGAAASAPITAVAASLSETAANKQAIQAMLAAWMAGDASALQALLSNDIEWTIAGTSAAAGTTHGRAELMRRVLGPFGARFSRSTDRFRPRRVRGVYADGDVVIACFDAAGLANDGSRYSNSYVWLLTMRGGKVARATAFFDSIAFDALWARVPPAAP